MATVMRPLLTCLRSSLPGLLLAGCALRSDVTRVQRQLDRLMAERSRADSITAAGLASIARSLQSLYDSLAAQQEATTRMRGDLRVELYNIQQQLVAIQELTGQSQQRLTELRGQLGERLPQPGAAPAALAPAAVPAPAPVAAPGAPGAPGAPAAPGDTAGPGAEQLLDLSLQQLRRGSPSTARAGFAEFLRRFPGHARAVDAEYFAAEAWAAEQRSDSAAAGYRRVAQRWPASPRAASAWYKLGLQALAAGRTEDARAAFTRVVSQFPNSEEAALARARLGTLPRGR